MALLQKRKLENRGIKTTSGVIVLAAKTTNFLKVHHEKYRSSDKTMSGKVCVNISWRLSSVFMVSSCRNLHTCDAVDGEDLYKILGVNSNATSKQIKCAYYELSKLHHPDLNCDKDSASSTHRFQRINYAYEILGNESKRRDYDKRLNKHNDVDGSDRCTTKDIYKMDERTLRDFNEFRRKFMNRKKKSQQSFDDFRSFYDQCFEQQESEQNSKTWQNNAPDYWSEESYYKKGEFTDFQRKMLKRKLQRREAEMNVFSTSISLLFIVTLLLSHVLIDSQGFH
ncbi:DnaJ -like protein subfamily A member 3, mitochondrial [Trichinella pseudospiralis]|uniref:DnaJ-like protein subfamily A member 3, mitochondrial n=1 Tax=Trichinella pseudospiralis TaxID=6337 RepID=A0A0V1KCU5_TRIPS|nr:DnaJ -like protein subfamily A member 3, mitochondrial [Trichinella pseudospiralis]KRZ45119.1 DnaJ -like protein subfamily A member 3, mitochondrial [Trichinella pseudospiralis]